jgi:hypothetical protein
MKHQELGMNTFPTADSPRFELVTFKKRKGVPSKTSLNWCNLGGDVGVWPVDDLCCWDELRADMDRMCSPGGKDRDRNPKTENVKSVMYGVYNKSKWRESYDVYQCKCSSRTWPS